MNNRLDSLFKKIAYKNKSSYLLELFGFDAVISVETKESLINEDIKESIYQTEKIIIPINEENTDTLDISIINTHPQTASTFITEYKTEDTTKDFKPTNITEQFKSIWINLEQRRKWIYPSMFILFTTMLSFYVINSYISTQNRTEIATQEFIVLSDSLNDLYYKLDDIIVISTDSFYSKYDISNASADLQIVEAQLIAYENVYRSINYDFDNISRYSNIEDLEQNLNNHLFLINELDLIISYRILNTEILVYPNLPEQADPETINNLTIELSNISASSISNYEQLPNIPLFNDHNIKIYQSIEIANELHGQYLASLRNKELETSKSLILSIALNKDFISQSYENTLDQFENQITVLYNSLIPFP